MINGTFYVSLVSPVSINDKSLGLNKSIVFKKEINFEMIIPFISEGMLKGGRGPLHTNKNIFPITTAVNEHFKLYMPQVIHLTTENNDFFNLTFEKVETQELNFNCEYKYNKFENSDICSQDWTLKLKSVANQNIVCPYFMSFDYKIKWKIYYCKYKNNNDSQCQPIKDIGISASFHTNFLFKDCYYTYINNNNDQTIMSLQIWNKTVITAVASLDYPFQNQVITRFLSANDTNDNTNSKAIFGEKLYIEFTLPYPKIYTLDFIVHNAWICTFCNQTTQVCITKLLCFSVI